jgi:hypothetical protein
MHAILNTPCYGLGQVQNHAFFFSFFLFLFFWGGEGDILSKQERQLRNKTANKAMGMTRYSFPDPLYTLFNSGLF